MADKTKKINGKNLPITDEVATVENDIFRDYMGNTIINPDKVIKTESGGKGLELYEDLMNDDQVESTFQSRKLAVIGKEWDVTPAGEDKEDIKEADYVREVFENFKYDEGRKPLLSGLILGFKVSEIMWEYSEGDVWIKEWVGKSSRRFVFDLQRNLKLLTLANMVEGIAVPEKKFLIFRNTSDNGSPYGRALGSCLYWPVWFKKNATKFWMIFADKYGSPTAVGKYPSGASKEQQEKLMEAIEAIQQESAIKIPDSMVIELLEATRSGTIDTYEKLCTYMDGKIAKVILGQNATTEITSAGSYAASKVSNEIRLDYVKADADLLCECQNKSVVKWVVDYNFPARNRNGYPQVWIRTEQEKDLLPLAQRDLILIRDMGLDVEDQYLYGKFHIPEPKAGAKLVNPNKTNGNSPATQPQPMAFAEKHKQHQCPICFAEKNNRRNFTKSELENNQKDNVDLITDQLLNEANFDPMIDEIKKLSDECNTLEELRDRLLEKYKDMDVIELGNLMQKAFMTADILGRAEVLHGDMGKK